jgi:hypothetical protein
MKSNELLTDLKSLSAFWKEQVALALLLLKDFKNDGKFDADLTWQIIKLAESLGVADQFHRLLSQIPPMEIKPRQP